MNFEINESVAEFCFTICHLYIVRSFLYLLLLDLKDSLDEIVRFTSTLNLLEFLSSFSLVDYIYIGLFLDKWISQIILSSIFLER